MPSAPASSRRSLWTNPTTSSASAPAMVTTSGGPGSGLAGWGAGGRGQAGLGAGGVGGRAGQLTPAPHPSPTSSSSFCRNAATSLSLFYNNGARPCGCHEVGSTGPTCQPFGGQCPCRAHVIGRDCSRCATGYWGFPSCRREYPSPQEHPWGPDPAWPPRKEWSACLGARRPSLAASVSGTPGLAGLSRRFWRLFSTAVLTH